MKNFENWFKGINTSDVYGLTLPWYIPKSYIKRFARKAYEAGYEDGYPDGYEDGYNEGYQE